MIIFNFYFLAEEKALVEEVFNNAIDVLSDDDKKLPQVKSELLPYRPAKLKLFLYIFRCNKFYHFLKEALEFTTVVCCL